MFVLVWILLIVSLLAVFGAGVMPRVLPAAAILACVGCLAGARPLGPDRRLAMLASGIVLFLIATALPLPAFMDGIIGHRRAEQNAIAAQAIRDAGKLSVADTPSRAFALTRDRAGTLRLILLAIAGFAVAALASRLRPPHDETFLKALVILGAVVAVLGATSQWLVPEGKSLWWVFRMPHGQPVGCFLNRNHFGGFVALLCPAALILFSSRLGRKEIAPAAGWALVFLVMTIAVVMSLSRGAWLAYAASLFAVIILALASRRLLMVGALLCLLALVFWGVSRLPHEEVEDRARTLTTPTASETARMRLSTWQDTLKMLPDYTFLGTGANAFRMVFPQYRTASTRKSFKHAENEYLQTPAEFGFIGTALLIGLAAVVAGRWYRNHARGTPGRLIETCVGAALIVAAVHGVFDFAIRIPLYFIVLAALVGLVMAPAEPTPPGARRFMLAPLAGLIAAILVSLQGMRLHDLDSPDFIEKAGPDELCRALNWSPTSWQVWYHLGLAATRKPDGTGDKLGEYCMSRAAECDPNNYQVWNGLCRVRMAIGDSQGAREAYARLKALRDWQQIEEMER